MGDAFNDVYCLLGARLFKGPLKPSRYLYKGFSALLIGECYRLFGWYLLCELNVRERDFCYAGYLIPNLGWLYAALLVVITEAKEQSPVLSRLLWVTYVGYW